jgi:hypothetical protein
MILAPIAGGALFDAVGKDFRLTTDIMTAVCLGWSLLFFIFNVGFKIYSQEHKIEHMMENLRHKLMQHKKDQQNAEDIATEKSEDIMGFIHKKREEWNNGLSVIEESRNATFVERETIA